jgi:hypothetical protein
LSAKRLCTSRAALECSGKYQDSLCLNERLATFPLAAVCQKMEGNDVSRKGSFLHVKKWKIEGSDLVTTCQKLLAGFDSFDLARL